MLLAGLFLLVSTALSAFALPAETKDLTLHQRQVNARYIWTAFTSNSESNLYVYTSSDATTWTLLAGPTYTPPSGLIRDPSVMYHTEYLFLFEFIALSLTQKLLVASTISPTQRTGQEPTSRLRYVSGLLPYVRGPSLMILTVEHGC
jgi:hypothetical protein